MPTNLDPLDPTSVLAWRGRGNPLAAHVSSAISNCFPGLEFDFRATWKNIFESVELHEAHGQVISVDPGGAGAAAGLNAADSQSEGDTLISVDGLSVRVAVLGPRTVNGAVEQLGEGAMEWSNALVFLHGRAGQQVNCVFRRPGDPTTAQTVSVNLTVRRIFDGTGIAADDKLAAPGVLTQGLCSPWQNDYRECGCYYWAASRPDYVNVEVNAGVDSGHNWMHKGRTPATPKTYVRDRSGEPDQLTYEDLFKAWETELRFVRRGQDSE